MKNKLSLGILSGLFAAVIMASPAFAWHFLVDGSGLCQPDGSYKITWTINNTSEPQSLIITKVTASSSAPIMPAPTTVPAHSTASYVQTVDGTKPGVFSLSITGHWKGDKSDHYSTKKVYLRGACTQPVVPPVTPPVTPPAGGMGGGTPEPVPAPIVEPVAATVETPQVIAPIGAVNAGNGGAPKIFSLASLIGLAGSLTAVGFGVRGFKKQS